jgi:G3E family GTPase
VQELYLITGFLGAGKTTFINAAAKAFPGKRIAVIVNEFGKQGVDGGLLSGKGFGVTEISNGSVFCVCRMDMFIDALAQAAQSSADALLVETSGLSNPTNIDDILRQTEKAAGTRFDYKGCICLVDAVNFEKVFATAVVVPDQVRQASLVVINKTDLADEVKVKTVKNMVRELNPDCLVCETSYAELPPELLAGLTPKPDRVLGGKQDLFTNSLTFTVMNKPGKDALIKFLGETKNIYRCKGYTALEDGYYFIDGVLEDITATPVKDTHEPGIVLLYKTLGNMKKKVQEAALAHRMEIEWK